MLYFDPTLFSSVNLREHKFPHFCFHKQEIAIEFEKRKTLLRIRKMDAHVSILKVNQCPVLHNGQAKALKDCYVKNKHAIAFCHQIKQVLINSNI